jgi:ribosomal-protein-alanine acetyltransferase
MQEPPCAGADFSIRPMEVGDVERVAEIAGALAGAPRWPLQIYREIFQEDVIGRRVAIIAEAAGEVMGFLICGVILDEAELESIAVAGEWQGRGVGARLLAAVIRDLRLTEIRVLRLEVRESNRRARELYRRAGFVCEGIRPGYYDNPTEDAVLLRLELTS